MRPRAIAFAFLLAGSSIAGLALHAVAQPPPFPALRYAYTLGTADGGVDGIRLVFAGPVDARHAHPSHFTVTGCTCLSQWIDEYQAYSDHFALRFQPEMPTNRTPTVRYNGGAGNDAGPALRTPENNAFQYSASPTWETRARDKVRPGILEAVTMDLDGNGLVDAYRVNFTEAIDDNHFVYTQWHVAGTRTRPILTGSRPNDPQIFVPFEERAYLHTGSLPQLTYLLYGGNGLRDLYLPDTSVIPGDTPNALENIGEGRVFERDGASARLVRAIGREGSATGYGIFSEPVVTATGSPPTLASFDYADLAAGGAVDLAAVQGNAGSAIVGLTLTGPATPADLGAAGDELRIVASALRDSAGNAVDGSARLQADMAGPGTAALAVAAVADTTAVLAWTTPADVDLDHVEVRLLAQGGGQTAWAAMPWLRNVTAAPSVPQTTTLTGLTPYRSYEAAIRPVDLLGNLAAQETHATFTTLPPAPPPPPPPALPTTSGGGTASQPYTGLIADLHEMPGSLGPRSIALEWTPPANPGASGYHVRYATPALTPSTFEQGIAGPAPVTQDGHARVWIDGLAPGTRYTVGIRPVSPTGANGTLVFREFTTTADGPAPPRPLALSSPSHPDGVGRNAANATLLFANVTDPPAVVSYRFFIGAQPRNVSYIDQAARSPLALGNLTEGRHVVRVAAFGPWGRTESPPYVVVVDRTPPGVPRNASVEPRPAGLRLTWGVPEDLWSAGNASVRWRSGPFPDGTAWDSFGNESRGLAPPFDLARLAGGQTYTVAVRAVDEAGNAGPHVLLRATTLVDPTPPEGELAPLVLPVLPGNVVPRVHAEVRWTPATDPETHVQYRYAVAGQWRELGPSDPVTDVANAALQGLPAGKAFFLVRAESPGGVGPTETTEFTVRPITPADVDSASAQVVLRVRRNGGSDRLEWTVPDLDPRPAGLQVWFTNGTAGRLLADVPAASGTFVHEVPGDEPARYLVTAHYGLEADLGYMAEAPDIAAAPGAQLVAAAPGFPWVLAGIAAVLAVGAGVAAWAWWRRRGRGATGSGTMEGPAYDGGSAMDGPPTPAVDGTPAADGALEVSCYACPAVYVASGPRPLETTCPSCGARGLLQ